MAPTDYQLIINHTLLLALDATSLILCGFYYRGKSSYILDEDAL